MGIARRFFFLMTALTLAFCALCCFALFAEACTGVYVGQEASDDGSIIIARSNDTQGVYGNYVQVVDRVDNQPGRTMPVDNERTVFAEIPASTYHYICTPWMDSTTAINGKCHDSAACINECGVSMTMSVTAFANKNALAADPLVKQGLTENCASDLVLCQSATAREAVETLLGLIDAHGSSECNVALIADQKEAWCIEMYTGHQYAAVRLPADKVSVFGNEYGLEFLSDYEECITSPELESLPKEHGFAVNDTEGRLNLFETYSGTGMNQDYSHMRTWIGHQLLAPSVFGADYNKEELYPLCFTPDKRVSPRDVMELMRNRFEGTPYSPDETGRTDMRVIGTDTAMSVHVMQVHPKLPADMSAVLWECTGPAPYGVFVPFSNACAKASEAYGRNQPADEAGVFDVDNYPYYASKGLTTLCVERNDYQAYGAPVRGYWSKAEDAMTSTLHSVLETAAAMEDTSKAHAYVESYCTSVQEKSFQDARQLLNDVLRYHAENSNTLKNGHNPETLEVYSTVQPIDPMKVSLDPSAYAQKPAA